MTEFKWENAGEKVKSRNIESLEKVLGKDGSLPYQSLKGSLQYASAGTRPDIIFVLRCTWLYSTIDMINLTLTPPNRFSNI